MVLCQRPNMKEEIDMIINIIVITCFNFLCYLVLHRLSVDWCFMNTGLQATFYMIPLLLHVFL